MSETKHTPGPWLTERIPLQSRGGSNTCWKIGPFVACIYDDWRPREIGISEKENKANARLIAAAPDLLEACEDLLHEFCGGGDRRMSDAEVMSMAHAAINKAKGEQQ